MTLLALLLVGAIGAAGTAWALPRGGTSARVAALGGVIGLALIAILAAASPTPALVAAEASASPSGGLWNGALVANGYLRLVVVLAATTAVVMSAITWLLRGVAGLRGLLPASLAALVGTTVALGASSPQLGLVAAGATGLSSIPVLLATPRAVAAGVAAREVRIAVATALVVLAVASVLPTLARLVAANGAGASSPSGSAAAVAFGLLAVALVVAARVGATPYHVRVSALTDSAAEGSLPLVLAWLPLPLAAVSVGVVLNELAPLGLPVGSAQGLIVILALLATVAAGLVAGLQDDLRHAVGYLTLADLGLVVLAFAALDPAAWGPARTWLLAAALSKSALAAWALVTEDRFETRSVPDLRGWLRPSPLLGLALALIVLATYGLPGWAVLTARLDLTRLAAGGPWNSLLLVASLLTLPAYARWLWLGIGVPTSHVDGATPEFLALRAPSGRTGRRLGGPMPRRGRDTGLPVEQETEGSYSLSAVAPRAPMAPSAAARPSSSAVPAIPAAPASSQRAAATVAQAGPASRGPAVAPKASARGMADGATQAGVRRRATGDPTPIQQPASKQPPIQQSPTRAVPKPETERATGGSPDLGLASPPRPAGSSPRIRGILSAGPKAVADTRLWGGASELPATARAEGRAVAKPAPATAEVKRAAKPASGAKPLATPAVQVSWGVEPAPPRDAAKPAAEPLSRERPSVARPKPRVVAAPPTSAAPAAAPAPLPEPTLFDLPDPDRAISPEPTPPELGSVRPGTGVGRRTRPPSDPSGSSLMTAPRAPEASKALPPSLLAGEGEEGAALASPEVVGRRRSRRAPSGPDTATRAAAAVRRHRTDLLSAAVLALAILATVVAAGAFDVSKAACAPTEAVPTVSASCS